MSAPGQSEGGTGAREFTTTHWSVVLSAGRDSSAQADALSKLCRVYWWPLYAFVRRQGHSPHDAQDLTQAFFARLLEKNYLSAVDPRKGKFRSFLLAALEHFLANEWRDATRKNEEASSPLFRPTGKTPFDAQDLLAAGLDEMRRTICEREPPKPSTRLTQELVAADVRRRNTGELYQTAASPRRLQELIHQLRGDLDWIVMKCKSPRS